MVIVSRLHSPMLGLLTGFFYVTLPVTAYFGRMLCHESPSQFFCLLMLHGYLQWTGVYGPQYRRLAGARCYAVGAVLGIGTGWAAVLMAGLIWLWQCIRVFRGRSALGVLLWLTVLPVASLAAVVLHILRGSGWDFSMLGALVGARVGSSDVYGPTTFGKWLGRNWDYLNQNVTALGIWAAILYLIMIPAILRFTSPESPLRQVVHDGKAVVPIMLTAVQGLVWIVALKRQSYIHEYWQYFVGPLFAVSLASTAMVVFLLLARKVPRIAALVMVALLVLPMPLFADSLDKYHNKVQISRETLVAFKRLGELVPPPAPAMVSAVYPQHSETFGHYTVKWFAPEIIYYARRPLIQTTDIREIESNPQHAAAYLLELSSPASYQLARALAANYEFAPVENHHVIFLLNKPRQR